ncbi:HAMP domain-containing sensor histidine kinase [Sphingomonas sp.]|uniref:sensor histidine kinase n=1 Tax=Sphingomonas sp. TaxID=28214 RepID=UPI001B17B4F6|nr:HAMP domain-containing sensor histidine kinase [Sphingomonas sp.]MBO9712670.1 HAMP domain-containing histidine kinase [Sphingomonas sp.]
MRAGAGPSSRRLRPPGSLGGKLVWMLTGIGLIAATALTLLMAMVIVPSFNRLERQQVLAQADRTRAALADYARVMESVARASGEGVAPQAMASLDVEGVAWVGLEGRVRSARWVDAGQTTGNAAMRDALAAAAGSLDFARVLEGRGSASFYLRMGGRLAAVGVARVPGNGHVLMARTIGSRQLSSLLQLAARIDLSHAANALEMAPGSSTLVVGVPVPGPRGEPVATAAFSVSRDISTLGTRLLLLAVIGSSLLLAFVLIVLRRAITRLVLRPLNRVEQHMGVVRESGELDLLTEAPRNDEIGSLVASFNSMLRQLQGLREQLEAQSFAMGRSESAVAVMHNVRNALNPVTTVMSQGLDRPPAVDRATLDRALAELVEGRIPAARRRKLVAFLAAAIEAGDAERDERHRQLDIGREALRHVLDIIGRQQEVANARPQLGSCDLVAIVAQNAVIARYSGGTAIEFRYPAEPCWVLANRVILSQVVGNLFSNAVEAIAATGRGEGSIAVTIEQVGERVRIRIRDDGEGFDADIADRLFQRGYSTREEKSGGLGLHWCANSMRAMEGTLALESLGRGYGACAMLSLKAASVLGIQAEVVAAVG